MSKVLYLGRFQPFHNGHLSVIRELSNGWDKVIIALCSAQKHHTERNPYTVWERYMMIAQTLAMRGIDNFEIVPIPDIDHAERWADYMNAIFGDYDVVVTNNPDTRRYFEGRGDEVIGTPILNNGESRVSGVRVRECIKNSDNDTLKELVPEDVYILMTLGGLKERIL